MFPFVHPDILHEAAHVLHGESRACAVECHGVGVLQQIEASCQSSTNAVHGKQGPLVKPIQHDKAVAIMSRLRLGGIMPQIMITGCASRAHVVHRPSRHTCVTSDQTSSTCRASSHGRGADQLWTKPVSSRRSETTATCSCYARLPPSNYAKDIRCISAYLFDARCCHTRASFSFRE